MIGRLLHATTMLSLLICGCATPRPNIPSYPPLDPPDTLRILAERSEHIRALSAEALVTLARDDGQTIRLDSALVMQPPDHLRLRAWKFGRAVFDLTVTPDGAWLIAPDDEQQREQIRRAAASTTQFARQWSMLMGAFFGEPDLQVVHIDSRLMRVQLPPRPGQPTIVCEIDRPTLTPRQYLMLDDRGDARFRFRMLLDRYDLVDGIPFPRRVRAISDQGRIAIDMRSVELNGELAPAAFRPPRRAEKLP
jgi:hypothetical protein